VPADFLTKMRWHTRRDLNLVELNSPNADVKPKQIIFVKDLAERIESGSVKVTYRKTRKVGTYYVTHNRFKKISPNLLIEFYKHEKVDAYSLTDDEAVLAGVSDAPTIRKMFEKWYGTPIPPLYRNWFRIIGKLEKENS
jgi:hypothetical protein